MKTKELPSSIVAKVQQWMGNHSIVHYWQNEETYYIVARATSVEKGANDIHCLRVFPIGGEFVLSQDNVVHEV